MSGKTWLVHGACTMVLGLLSAMPLSAQHQKYEQGQPSAMQEMMEAHQRMLADPVIRSRIETDPLLQQMLRAVPVHSGAARNTASSMPGMTAEGMMVMHQRMLADPVIRERMATDPMLRHVLVGMPMEMQKDMQGMSAMQDDSPAMAMQHDGMPMSGVASTAPAYEGAIQFMIRLLTDASVQARIVAQEDLRRMWTDPEVQHRLAELAKRSAAWQPAAPQQHQ